MLIIPTLTIRDKSNNTLYDIIFKENFDWNELIQDIFLGNNGFFFVALIIQQACISSGWQLLNGAELAESYFSPWLTIEKRKLFYEKNHSWRRKETSTFQYGYLYSQMMIIFAISIFYSATVPLVAVAAVLFSYMKHYVDAYLLLTYFRKEIDSSGKLTDTTTNTALMIVIGYQISMLSLFISLNKETEALVCTIVFIVSSLYAVLSYEDVYDLSDLSTNIEGPDSMMFENEELYAKQNKEMSLKWSALYNHPLVINQSRKAKEIGVEIKQFDHWEQF